MKERGATKPRVGAKKLSKARIIFSLSPASNRMTGIASLVLRFCRHPAPSCSRRPSQAWTPSKFLNNGGVWPRHIVLWNSRMVSSMPTVRNSRSTVIGTLSTSIWRQRKSIRTNRRIIGRLSSSPKSIPTTGHPELMPKVRSFRTRKGTRSFSIISRRVRPSGGEWISIVWKACWA